MFDFAEINMENLVVHMVGNKLRNEGYTIAADTYKITDGNVEELLLKYFLSSFKEKIVYKFCHETDIHLNEVYMYASNIFINRETFYEQSVNILRHLYEKSSHPQIKGGEFYVAYFSGCTFKDERVDAIGIFKTENKENYLKITGSCSDLNIAADTGINIKKLDKGTIIFNSCSVDGYRVAVVDNVNKGNNEALYWKDEFLRLTAVQDEYFHTQNYLNLCQDFAENVYGPIYNADKKDKVVFMNEAISYFASNNEFQLDDFVENVIRKPELKAQFKEYKSLYDTNQGQALTEAFPISAPAVKSVKRKFKNLIKLDTDIEIRIKTPAEAADTTYIERGYDEEKGMHYYKVYFNEEE